MVKLIALDTNVVIRFLVNDDERQGLKVKKLLEKAEKEGRQFYISLLVIQEMIWVLSSAYECSKKDIINALTNLLQVSVFNFENHDVLVSLCDEALNEKCGITDTLIGLVNKNYGSETTLTFDKKASRSTLFKAL